MRTVWKYDLAALTIQSVAMPLNARIIHVAAQGGVPDAVQMWAEVETDEPQFFRRFAVGGTGHLVPDDGRYVGTALAADGALVWHVYEVRL